MTYKNFPLFNIVLDPDAEEEGLSVISIVDHPAVEQPLFCFSAEEKKKMMFIDETKEQHCITSVALLADTPIYRYSVEMGDYYVVFEKQTVRDLVEKYAKDGYQNLVSFNHDGQNVDGFVMIESFFVDKEKGINPTQFKDLPDGSWCVTYKCTNDELWETIKNEDLNGYSVEINCTIEPAKEGQQIYEEPEPMFEDEDEEFMNWLDELLKALEEADCEIVMESDKDRWLVDGDGEYWLDEEGNKVPAKCPKCGADVGVYIKGEPVFLCSECGEYLGTVKFPDDEMFSVEVKKKINLSSDDEDDDEDGLWSLNFEVERTDIAKAIDQKKAVLIDGKERWVHSLGKRGNNDVVVMYDPKKGKWEIKNIKDIETWEPTKTSIGEFPDVPKDITDNDDITIQRNVNSNDISSLIHSRTWVQISYDDEQPHPHTGFRQCAIIAWGTTKRGNECYRIWEQFGDSRSASEGEDMIPNYRLILARRCKAFKPMIGTQPYGRDVLDDRVNWNGDRSMDSVFDHIELTDFDND